MKNSEVKLSYSTKIIFSVLALVLLLTFIILFSEAVVVFAVAILIALILHPLVTAFQDKGLSRKTSTFLVFGIMIFVGYIGMLYIIPQLSEQVDQLVIALRKFSIHKQIVTIDTTVRKYIPIFPRGTLAKRIEEALSTEIVSIFSGISGLLSSIISIVAVLVIVPFITFFALKDNKKIIAGILSLVPNKYFEMSYSISGKVSYQLGRFVRAWIFDATFVGVSCGLGFYFIGIPNALPLGIIAGTGHLIPYFGPIIGGIPAIIISFIQYGSFVQLPVIILLILIIYTLDNGFVQPTVFSKSVDMHPIIIILLIIAGSQLAGIIGMLLAVPVATVVKTLVKEIFLGYKNYRIARM